MLVDSARAQAQNLRDATVGLEHGGNCDIKDLSLGSKMYFPIYVPAGGLSMGDFLHFSLGAGEISFCGHRYAGLAHPRVEVTKLASSNI